MALKERSGGSDHRPVVSASMVNKLKAGRTDLGYCSRFATVLVREKQFFYYFRADCAPDISSALCLSWRRERTGGGQSPPPLYPGLWPPKSPLRGTFDLSLQASGRAEAASVQNTALRPHPCGLPRPSGNVSAILRPPTPAVSASAVKTLKAGRKNRRSGKALAATRQKTAPRVARVRRSRYRSNGQGLLDTFAAQVVFVVAAEVDHAVRSDLPRTRVASELTNSRSWETKIRVP